VIAASARIHPTADLEPDVAVGPGTTIWHRAQLRVGARIGADCVIGRDVFIDEGVSIGDRVKIQNGALIYHGVTVEDGVFVGPGAILTNDRYPRAITTSGAPATAEDWTISPIVLHHGSSIGAGAIVVAGVDVHDFATVGAGAVVTRSVPAHALAVGNPARRIGWVCACGMRLETLDGVPSGPTMDTPLTELRCPTDGRTYAFRAADEQLAEHSSPSPTGGS
jgi:UDP-2-acetamido-3-amino-2,3-dideoxy-glucuronate N-acetyltransferase